MTQRSQRGAALLAAALALVGCSRVVVSPIVPPPYRDEIAAPYDATWRALVRALVNENAPLRVVAKDSGVISSDDFISPIGVYTDCGRIGEALLEGEAMVAFTLFVQPGRDGVTLIQVNSKMRSHAYRRGGSGGLKTDRVFDCVSTGRWEANLLDSVRRLVKE
ncbi:MAG TPA: hypothetical protein VHC93_10045 [Methylomirabilota bacterium]|nr:hypothetical protein [Methylomirabilota bacterium]